jgi:hypothetical protein
MADRWIVIPNWDKFQHYKHRNPTWIKVYTELNSDPNWEALTMHQRGLLVTIWIEHARSRGQVRYEQAQSWVGSGFKHASLEALVDAGFIEVSASRPLAQIREEKKRTKAFTSTGYVDNGNGPEFQIPKDLLKEMP